MTPSGETFSTRDRLRVLGGLGGAAMGTALAGNPLLPERIRAAEPPDIFVLVMNDARNGDQIALPRTMAHLGANGAAFPNFFMTMPLCCPARATLLTGLYPHHHGVYDNTDANHGGWLGFVRSGNRQRATGGLMQAAGYRTVALGTYLNGARPGKAPEPGWNVSFLAQEKHSGKKRSKKGKKKRSGKTKMSGAISDSQMVSTIVTELGATSRSQPLYFHVGFNTPHVPAIPSPAYAGRFAGAQVARDPSFNEADVSGKPAYVRKLRPLSPNHQAWLDSLHQRRLECLLGLDDALATL